MVRGAAESRHVKRSGVLTPRSRGALFLHAPNLRSGGTHQEAEEADGCVDDDYWKTAVNPLLKFDVVLPPTESRNHA